MVSVDEEVGGKVVGLEDFLAKLRDSLKRAVKLNQRRMVVITGEMFDKLRVAVDVLDVFATVRKRKKLSGLFVAHTIEKNSKPYISLEFINRNLENIYSKHAKKGRISFESIEYKDTVKALGKTFDVLIMDMSRQLNLNDVGRLVETVRGGGLILILAPPLQEWKELRTEYHEHLLTPPYTIKDVKPRYNKWFIRKLFEHEGIFIYDGKTGSVLKLPEEKGEVKPVERKVQIPKKTAIPRSLYKMALTNGQVKVLQAIEKLLDKKRTAIVITADRGRGKSVAVGIGLAGLVHVLKEKAEKKRVKVIVTSPEPGNVQPLFEFLVRSLKKLDYTPRVRKNEDGDVIEVDCECGVFRYIDPYEASGEEADVFAVDEAAGIPVPLLYRIIGRNDKAIFSSTIHGYEGAGRGFSIRFLKGIKEMKKLTVVEVEMEEPIRYAEGDPIERWVYDALLLDAEPAPIDEKTAADVEKLNVELAHAPIDDWLLKPEAEEEFKQFVGIYVYAHYRNRPNDIIILTDSPHHDAFMLRAKSTGKVVNALHVAYEGELPDQVIEKMYSEKFDVSGNIIPSLMVHHQRDKEFPKLRGIRIVRIATHPDLFGKGLGSKTLELLEEYAKKNGFEWIGAVFGASSILLNFWIKNGFLPVHASTYRNPISGEFSVAVVKPLTKRARKMVLKANREFRLKFIDWLSDALYDMEPDVADLLLQAPEVEDGEKIEPNLTFNQWDRLYAFAREVLAYPSACDAVRGLVTAYFLDESRDKPRLSRLQRKLLILRVLQRRSWSKTAKELKKGKTWCQVELTQVTRHLLKHYTPPEEVVAAVSSP